MKKLVMIGCDSVGSYHLEHLLQLTHLVELAGFCDLVLEKAENFCQTAGSGKAYTNFRKMYDEINPDMVFICVPPFAHGEIEYETIKRKIPFFVEKPVALDMDLAKDIAKKVEEANLITAVGFQCRYSNLVAPTVNFLKNNPVALVEASRITDIPQAPWWKDKKKSGGMLAESTIHQLDIIRYMFDEPETVMTLGAFGWVNGPDMTVEELTTTMIRFRGGALGVVMSGCYATHGASFDSNITFSARDKRAVHKIIESLEIVEEKKSEKQGPDRFVTKGDGVLGKEVESRYYRQEGDAGLVCDQTFIEAVINNDPSQIRSPYSDALKTLAFALACNESIETGKQVKVEY